MRTPSRQRRGPAPRVSPCTQRAHADVSALAPGRGASPDWGAGRRERPALFLTLLRNGWYTGELRWPRSQVLLWPHGALIAGSAGDGLGPSAALTDWRRGRGCCADRGRLPARPARVERGVAPCEGFSEFAAASCRARPRGRSLMSTCLEGGLGHAALVGAGLPEGFAALLADSGCGAR